MILPLYSKASKPYAIIWISNSPSFWHWYKSEAKWDSPHLHVQNVLCCFTASAGFVSKNEHTVIILSKWLPFAVYLYLEFRWLQNNFKTELLSRILVEVFIVCQQIGATGQFSLWHLWFCGLCAVIYLNYTMFLALAIKWFLRSTFSGVLSTHFRAEFI